MALKFIIINRCTNYRILNNVQNHTMQKQLEAVKLFHTTYGLGISENMKADLGTQKNNLRFDLMKEENEEYLEAVQNNDIVEIDISKAFTAAFQQITETPIFNEFDGFTIYNNETIALNNLYIVKVNIGNLF